MSLKSENTEPSNVPDQPQQTEEEMDDGESESDMSSEKALKYALSNLSFVGRYGNLADISPCHPFVVLTPQIACSGILNILIIKYFECSFSGARRISGFSTSSIRKLKIRISTSHEILGQRSACSAKKYF